jgi:hypothetical protein
MSDARLGGLPALVIRRLPGDTLCCSPDGEEKFMESNACGDVDLIGGFAVVGEDAANACLAPFCLGCRASSMFSRI